MSSASNSLTETLRAALRDPGDSSARHLLGRTEAAVLVPLYVDQQELHAVFTRRGGGMRRHAGEISFPGGRRDDGEQDLSMTALREAEEEIGLPPEDVELLGTLKPTPTGISNYAVYPFVGLIQPGRQWTVSASEVDAVLELRLADLRTARQRRRLLRRGVPFRTDVYGLGEHLIWGATARMVTDLLRRLDPLLGPAPA